MLAKKFSYRNFTITSVFRFEIALTFIYLVKLFRATTRLTLTSISIIDI